MNKHKSKASTAFSLVELSIVILIVGIIIAGVTQSSRLVRQSKLKSAQSLTQSSPVNGMSNIAVWFETTQDESFPATLDDEANLVQWNDTNPQTTSKLYAVPAAAITAVGSANIVYDNDGINGLPSIKFAGAAANTSVLTVSSSATTLTEVPVVTNADSGASNAFTAFMVYKANDAVATSTTYTVLYNGTSATNGWGYLRGSTGIRTVQIGSTASVGGSTLPATQEIAAITYSGYNSGSLAGTKATRLYINGGTGYTVSNVTDPSVAVVLPTARMLIGGQTSTTNTWRGLISEIIIFDSVLKNQDLRDVGNYLSKKYNIPVS